MEIFETIPKATLDLGIGSEDYAAIAKNINRIKYISKDARKSILQRGNEYFSQQEIKTIKELLEEMAYDRKVYELAELDYSRGPPQGESLFITGIVDYLLRNKKNS